MGGSINLNLQVTVTCLTSTVVIPITLQEDIINKISRRIYSIRCSLVHSKEAPENSNFIPNLNDEILDKEVPLIKFVASKVIENSNLI